MAKIGRPKKENPKNRQIRLRMTEEDYQLLDVFAKECETTKTKVMMVAFYTLLERFPKDDLHRVHLKVAMRINEKKIRERMMKDQ